MSNIVFNFAKNVIMNILGTLDRCINMIPKELIENEVIYIELDQGSYKLILEEVDNLSKVNGSITIKEERVTDIGKAFVIGLGGYKIVVALDKNKVESSDFYFAFKTKII